MKRSPILQPLSREHHSALSLARACKLAAASADSELTQRALERAKLAFPAELEPHFLFEEHSLLPLLHGTPGQALAEQTLAEHRQLRALFGAIKRNEENALADFAACLSDHIHFEEHELFPALEMLLPEAGEGR